MSAIPPVVCCFCFLPSPRSISLVGDDLTGRVFGVIDGDTLEVLHNQRPECIRLSGIDCPEKGHAFGKQAKQAASELVFGKEVTLQTHGRDKYKRKIGEVIVFDGMNLNQELVKQGWCWWYRKYAPDDTVLEVLEKDAREGRKGLWADPQPVPPWEWRKRSRFISISFSRKIEVIESGSYLNPQEESCKICLDNNSPEVSLRDLPSTCVSSAAVVAARVIISAPVQMVQAGIDLYKVQRLMGDKSPVMT